MAHNFSRYFDNGPSRSISPTVWSTNLRMMHAYYHPEQLYYRSFPTRVPIVALVALFAQQADLPYTEAVSRYKPVMEFWLDKGARIDAKDAYGQTALHYAVRMCPMLALAEVLLQRGANVNMQNRCGITPLLSCVADNEASLCMSRNKCVLHAM